MQLGATEESLNDFLMAADLDPDNADVFYHRGQVYFCSFLLVRTQPISLFQI